jgi:hypothetical protein
VGWLFIVGLGIIWAAFLLPFGARRSAPASTVEEFERKMDLLAETNKSSTGRWVLVPRKGERFMGPRDRGRMRVRRRRRVVFGFLVQATGLTLLIGLFPPLRAMLAGTAILAVLLVAYVGLLLRIRVLERQRDRIERIRRSRRPVEFERMPVEYLRHATASNGNGNGNGHHVNGHANRHANGYASNGNGNGNGHGVVVGHALEEDGDPLLGAGISIVEDDVHVIIRRPSEVDRDSARTAAR